MSPLHRSVQTVRRWLRHSWLSRLPLLGRLGAAPTAQARKPQRPKAILETDQLDKREVVDSPYGVTPAALLAGTAVAGFAAIVTPTEVLWGGWSVNASPVAPQAQPQALPEATADPLFSLHHDVCFADWNVLPSEQPVAALPTQEDAEETEPIQAVAEVSADLSGSLNDPVFLDRIKSALADLNNDNDDADTEEPPQGSDSGFSALADPADGGGGGGGGGSGDSPAASQGGGGGSSAAGSESLPPGLGVDQQPTPTDFVSPFLNSAGRFVLPPLPAANGSAQPGGSAAGAGASPGGDGAAGAAPQRFPAIPPELKPDFARTPLAFEANRGQVDARSPYLARGAGYNLFLTDTGADLVLSRPRPATADDARQGETLRGSVRDVVRVQFVGANAEVGWTPSQELATRSNYFRAGSAVALTDITNYAGVTADNVWDGVSVAYTGSQHNLRFDFHVAAGADVGQIRLAYPGLSKQLDESGRLILSTPGGDVIQDVPVLYQHGDAGQRQSVSGRYLLRDDGSVGFQVDAYDATRALVIDPTLLYGSYLGGSANDFGSAVATDLQGNLYVAGTTWSSGLPNPSYGSLQGDNDAFVAKFNARGDTLLYVAYVGGGGFSNDEQGLGLAVDASGAAYLVGKTNSSTFPTTTGAFQTSLSGTSDAFVTKLNQAANALVYSTLMGGSDEETAYAVAVDAAGKAFVVGKTTSTNFDTQSADQGSLGGGALDTDAFVTAVAADGASLSWSTYFGGGSQDEARAVAVNASGQVAVTGWTQSSDLPTTSAYDSSYGGNTDAFVTRYSASGTRQVSSYYGGSGEDLGQGVGLTSGGQVVVVGATKSSSDIASGGSYDTTLGSTQDGFAVKLDGGTRSWGTYLGSDYGTEAANAVVLDGGGNVYVTGQTKHSVTWPGDVFHSQSDNDAFTLRLEADGASLGWLEFLGGSAEDVGNGIAADPDGNLVVVGSTTSTNLPTQSPFQASNNGQSDVFLARYARLGAPVLTGISTDSGSSATDFVTSDTTLTLSGTALPSATVSVYRAGVGLLGTTTASGGGAWSYDYTGTALGEGIHAFTFTATASGETGVESRPYLVTVDTTGPSITLDIASSTYDVTPELRVTATDPAGFGLATTVYVDVDLNNDGDFLDTSETGFTTATLNNGVALLSLSLGSLGTYRVQARASDKGGTSGTSAVTTFTVASSGSAWTATDVTARVDPLQGDALLQRGNLTLVHALDWDRSPGVEVGLRPALVYNSDRVSVKPIITAQVQSDNSILLPTTITAQLTWNGGSPQTAQTFDASVVSTGELITVAQQVSTAVTTTGAYSYSLTVTMDYGTPIVRTVNGTFYVVAEDASPYGAGWTLSGVDRLHGVTGGLLREYGSGGHSFYASLGGGAYTSPAGDAGTLTSSTGGGLTTYTYSLPDGRSWTFNNAGEQVKALSADGFAAVTYTYSSGAVSKVETPDGAVTTFTYASGLLSKMETGSRATTLTMASGDLTVVKNPDGGLRTLTYDGSTHRLTRWDLSNQYGTFVYASGALSNFTSGDGGATSLTPAILTGLSSLAGGTLRATVADPLARTSRVVLDTSGRATQVTSPDGGTTKYTRDANGWITAIDDPLGRHTTIARDAQGYATTITYAPGDSINYQYQSNFHALTQFRDERGNLTTFTYDAYGHQLTQKNALGQVTSMTYNAGTGLLETVKDALGRVTTVVYDSERRLQAQINAAGDRATFTYDSNGNVETYKDTLGRVTTTVNDALGRLLTQIDALGNRVTMTYDGAGQTLTAKDARGVETLFEYNARGLQTRVIEGSGTSVQRAQLFSYDNAGQQTGSRDANGVWNYRLYDAAGRGAGATDALQGQTARLFDLAGQQTRTIDELGNETDLTYCVCGCPVLVADALGNLITLVYDDASNRTGVIDAGGNRISIVYDALNREVSLTEGVGTADERTSTIVYDAVGNVVQRIDPLGIVTSLAYDSLNRVTTITEAVGTSAQRTATIAYDSEGNQIGTTDARGYRSESTYDSLNRLTVVTEAVGQSAAQTTTMVYDANGNVTSRVDGLGRTESLTYDALNRTVARTEAVGTGVAATATSLYDANGAMTGSIDALGKTWLSSVDVLGRPNISIDPLGHSTRSFSDATGEGRAMVDARGNRLDYQTDALNRTVRVADTLGNVTSTIYDAVGNVKATVDARGYRTTFTYDSLQRQTEVKNALGQVTTTVYDKAGNVVKTIDPLGKVYTFTYDNLNRRTSVTDPGAGIATTVYDGNGNVSVAIDPLGHRTTHTYDAANRLTKTTDALGGVVTFLYDTLGNRTGLIDPVGNRTTFVYDELNRQTKEIDPLGKTLTSVYDANGRLTQSIDRLGRKREFTYDDAGRMTKEVWKDAGGSTVNTLTFTYDAAGNQTSAADADGTYTHTYDSLNRVTKVQGLFGAVFTNSYDAVGNRTKVEDSFGGVQTTVYDGLNRVTTQLFGGVSQTPLRWDTTYTSRGQIDTVNRYSDLAGTTKIGETNFSYDSVGRVENLKHKNGVGTMLANYTHTYDAASRTTSEVLNGTTTNYGYDDTDQLTSAGTYAYDYDLNGNRDSAGYVTGSANRMTNDGVFTFTYDDEGNLTKKSKGASAETWTFTYDHRNQQIGVTQRSADGGGTLLSRATYTYDVFSNRVQADEYVNGSGTTTTKSAYAEPGNVFADLDSGNAMQTRYLRQDDAQYSPVVARIDGGGNTVWLYSDKLGSTRNVVNASGTLVGTVVYDAFGGIASESDSTKTGRFTFTGLTHQRQAGQLEANHRVYNPATGRWQQEDPIRWQARDVNLVRYVGNGPNTGRDRSGLEEEELGRLLKTEEQDVVVQEEWKVRVTANVKDRIDYPAGGGRVAYQAFRQVKVQKQRFIISYYSNPQFDKELASLQEEKQEASKTERQLRNLADLYGGAAILLGWGGIGVGVSGQLSGLAKWICRTSLVIGVGAAVIGGALYWASWNYNQAANNMARKVSELSEEITKLQMKQRDLDPEAVIRRVKAKNPPRWEENFSDEEEILEWVDFKKGEEPKPPANYTRVVRITLPWE